MSNSNIVDFQTWRDNALGASARYFGTTHETLLLLKAFGAIESPLIRGEIIRVAQDAAVLGAAGRPPESTA